MKKMWKIKKDSEGVSPVIATILMVAITVVLAAVLLVLVLNIGEDSITVSGQITAEFNPAATAGGNITVVYISQGVPLSDLKVVVPGGETTDLELVGDGTTVSSGSIIQFENATGFAAGQSVSLVYKGSVIGQAIAS